MDTKIHRWNRAPSAIPLAARVGAPAFPAKTILLLLLTFPLDDPMIMGN